MKNNKIFLDFEEEEILIGLIKLKQQISHHELFFKVNQLNLFNFYRANDLMAEDYFRHYKFPKFETYDEITQAKFTIFANKSFWSETKQTSPNELFQQGDEEKHFIDKEVDYIIFSKNGWYYFSYINFTQYWFDSLEEFQLYSEHELYQIIIYDK